MDRGGHHRGPMVAEIFGGWPPFQACWRRVAHGHHVAGSPCGSATSGAGWSARRAFRVRHVEDRVLGLLHALVGDRASRWRWNRAGPGQSQRHRLRTALTSSPPSACWERRVGVVLAGHDMGTIRRRHDHGPRHDPATITARARPYHDHIRPRSRRPEQSRGLPAVLAEPSPRCWRSWRGPRDEFGWAWCTGDGSLGAVVIRVVEVAHRAVGARAPRPRDGYPVPRSETRQRERRRAYRRPHVWRVGRAPSLHRDSVRGAPDARCYRGASPHPARQCRRGNRCPHLSCP